MSTSKTSTLIEIDRHNTIILMPTSTSDKGTTVAGQLGPKLLHLIKNKNLTYAQASSLIGRSPSSIWKLAQMKNERVESAPKDPTLSQAIDCAFGLKQHLLVVNQKLFFK